MENNYITISELSKYLKSKFDEDLLLRNVYLKGEISNFKAHSRGHYYFTLKDENSRISAIMFATSTKGLKFTPNDGMKVLVSGRVSVYEATGAYQIYVDDMLEDGVGNLYVAFEQLKEKLSKEGLFDKEHKKKIVRMPKTIGIVTAPTGAAIRDILTTIRRRFPICRTILFPALVQGNEACYDIAKKIEIANTYDIDTLIVGRGGGSLEDLWPFNEEVVARAIYNSKVPVISAVGHEVDFTIADFVADLRAPTPTAAAELAVVDMDTVISYLDTAKSRSYNAIINLIDNNKLNLNKIINSYVLKKHTAIYDIKEQKLDNLMYKINNAIKNKLNFYYTKLDNIKNSYLFTNSDILYKYKVQNLDNLINKLEMLNPLNTIKRGYAIVKFNDKVLSDINLVNKDDIINIEIKNGLVDAKIIEKR